MHAFICMGTAPLCKIAGAALTVRETETLRLLVSGMTDPAIAAALFISPRAVENHVARIFAKLGVHSRAAHRTESPGVGRRLSGRWRRAGVDLPLASMRRRRCAD